MRNATIVWRGSYLLSGLALAFYGSAAFSADTASPATPRLEFAFEELVTLGPAIAAGKTPYGARTMIPSPAAPSRAPASAAL
jgi:hypothetical protein